jgi:hypothetical protein
MNYTTNQQVFCLNALSNHSSFYNSPGTNAVEIARKTKTDIITVLTDKDLLVANNIQKEIGVWNLVWGPCVVAKDGKALNTMYIAANNSNDYVVAIAGTDMTSITDWCSEDFAVDTKVEWPLFKNTDYNTMVPMISQATFNGFTDLKGMIDIDQNVNAEYFLSSRSDKIKSITIAGHSLGGALSPVFALYLYQMFAKDSKIPVNCNPVAGPTPGDIVFAGYYDNQLGATTTRVWNSNDVVPHAWNYMLMQDIEALYFPSPACPPEVHDFVEKYRAETQHNNYTHVVADAAPFRSGMYNAGFSGLPAFLDELKCQHICAYSDYFQIGQFQLRVQKLLGLPNPYFSAGCTPVS